MHTYLISGSLMMILYNDSMHFLSQKTMILVFFDDDFYLETEPTGWVASKRMGYIVAKVYCQGQWHSVVMVPYLLERMKGVWGRCAYRTWSSEWPKLFIQGAPWKLVLFLIHTTRHGFFSSYCRQANRLDQA